MTVLLMKNTAAGRRAFAISLDEAKQMVADGSAVQDSVYGAIFEEVTDGERDQGYMTRNLVPVAKRRGRPPKVQPPAEPTVPASDDTPAAK